MSTWGTPSPLSIHFPIFCSFLLFFFRFLILFMHLSNFLFFSIPSHFIFRSYEATKTRFSFYSARNARIASIFARIASDVLATAIPSVRLSVCLSVRLSHAGIVSKQRHVARCSLPCQIAKCVYFCRNQKIFPRDQPWLQVTYPFLKAAGFDTFCLVSP